MKVTVYAICKNEEKFVDRWYESMKEADDIYVLDTGSTDNTIEKLKEKGVKVITKKIKPWRFDIARNESLKLVPLDTDICVCTDLDEVFEKNWRNTLEKAWKNCNRARYNYNWSLDEHNKPLVNFYIEKIHTRNNYIWKHPVHEVLNYIGSDKEKIITIDNITLNHYPDKNKSRSNYLPLLELSVKEEPEDDRNMHYLGREYMYYNMNNLAIKTLKKHLSLKSATWKDERCASYRFIARCYLRKNDKKNTNKYYDLAIKEAPYLREPYMEKALFMYEEKKYNEVIFLCNCALDIEKNPKTYINEYFSYNETIYDLLSLCYYYKNMNDLALYYIDKALKISPNDKRLLNNKEYFSSK